MSSRRRRSTDWGPPGASRSSWKTAETLARKRSRASPTTSSANPEAAIRQSLSGLFTSFRANTPWLYLDIDRDKAKLAGVSIAELFNTLQVYLGSLYVNDFNRFGRTWQVNVQGDANFRKQISDLTGLRVRNEPGGMVPVGSIASVRDVSGPR